MKLFPLCYVLYVYKRRQFYQYLYPKGNQNTRCCDGRKTFKKVKKILKKCLQFGFTCGIILKYAVIIWRETCDDAGGGPTRSGKFLRSMSDFKPGERTRMHLGNLRPLMQRRSDSLSGIDCDPSNAGFILCGDEKHGTV